MIGFRSDKQFHYNISDTNFTLAELKHAMFRGNSKEPGSLMRILSSTDKKLEILPKVSLTIFS